ncbi:MAG: hypothetical protein KAU21_20305 [Gammaproteobacteria bacterium]|nr:hypothetical protein [Gammaproteobacteria bacterium]
MTIITIEKLRQDDPELYRAVINQGVMIERSRVLAHLNVAKYYHSLEKAVEAVAAGTPVDEPYPYLSLHDFYCDIEDERNRLEFGW